MATTQLLDTGVERWAREKVREADLPGQVAYDTVDGQRIVVFNPYPKQEEFCKLLGRSRYRLFGGAVGPGKTLTLLMQAVIVCHSRDDGRGVQTLCLRRTMPQLESSFLREFRRHVPRELYRTYNDQKKVVTWWNGATTRFGSMQYEKDVWDYAGNEYARILWDELTQFLLKQWETIKPWNRCPHAGVPVGMDGASNPIGIGAKWVKHLFVDKKPAPEMEEPGKYRPEQYAFVPARVTDNPIYANDPAFLATLNDLPKALRDAMLQGLWTVAVGSYFDIFDRAVMSVRPENAGIESWWPRWISMDWGFDHNSVIHWHASSPANKVVTYRELVLKHTAPKDLAEQIVKHSVDGEGKREGISDFYLSPDAFAKRTDAATIAEQIGEVLKRAGMPQPSQASDDRVGGWQLLYQWLKDGAWLIGENCSNLLDTLPSLIRDEKRVEDILKVPGDDAADCARYGLYSRLKGTRPPYEQRVAQKVEAFAESRGKTLDTLEPTSGAMLIRQAMIAEKRNNRGIRYPFGRRFRPGGMN